MPGQQRTGGRVEVILPHKFNPRSYQKPFLEAREQGCRFASLVWHRRSGKDKTVLNDMIRWMLYLPDHPLGRVGLYYYFFPTFAQGKKVIWDGLDYGGFPFRSHFPEEIIKPNGIDKKNMQIHLVNGSIFQIVGTDNYNHILGTNAIGMVFSEFSVQDPMVLKLMFPIILENDGSVICIFTPRGKNHAFKLHNIAETSRNWFHETLTIDQTRKDAPGEDGSPCVTQEKVEFYREQGTEEEIIQQELYGSFEGFKNATFYGEVMRKARADGRICNVPYDRSRGVFTCWDLGVNDSTVIWFFQFIGGVYHWIDYYESCGEPFDHYLGVLVSKDYSYDKHLAPWDINKRETWSAKTVHQEALERGYRFEIVQRTSLLDGRNMVRRVITASRFDKTKCERGIDCLEQYRRKYNDALMVYEDGFVHDWASHGADGFRTGATGFNFNLATSRKKGKVKRKFNVLTGK